MNSNDKTNDKINQNNKKENLQEEYWLTKRIKKDYRNLKHFLSEKKKTFFWVIVVFIAFITMDVLTIGQLMENNGLSVKNNMKGGVMIGGDDNSQQTKEDKEAAKRRLRNKESKHEMKKELHRKNHINKKLLLENRQTFKDMEQGWVGYLVEAKCILLRDWQ